MLRRLFILALAVCALGLAPSRDQDKDKDIWQAEADRLALLLKWHSGSVVAEIGAGNGKLTAAAAERVGASGKIYTTEIDAEKLAHLKELAAKQSNVTVVEGAATDTNLPPACCDSIFMRLVYHHLTRPAEIDTSLLRSLKSGGRLAVIDEEPSPGSSVPEGVPENRGGHGIPQQLLIKELTDAGFKMETIQKDWIRTDEPQQKYYCVIFRKASP